jgi:hypothetical protein
LRAIHLLLWAGLKEKLDVKTVIWAVRNANRNRVNIVEDLLNMWLLQHDMNIDDLVKIEAALAEIKDQAEVESDRETLALVNGIQEFLDIS